MSIIKFKSLNNNQYIYSKINRSFINIPNLFSEIIDLLEVGKSENEITNLLTDKNKENEIKYYFRFYKFLKENGFLENIPNKLEGRYSPEYFQYNLSNINQVIFEVTDNCNLSCEYCGYGKYYDNFDNRTKKNLDFKFATNLIDFLFDYINSNQNTSVNKPIAFSFYGGEPLLNIDLVKKIVSYINSKKLKHNRPQFSLTTNALLLRKHIDFFVKNDFSILISLDGNYENSSYRVYHNNKNAFPEIYENILFVKDNYPAYFEKVRFNAVLHNRNSVEEIFDFFKKQFNKTPQISELHSAGVKESMLDEFWKCYKNTLKDLQSSEKYKEINQEMFIEMPEVKASSDLIFNYTDFVFNNYSDILNKKEQDIIPTGTCEPFSRRIFLTVNGKILPCEKVGHSFLLGRVTSDSVEIDFTSISNKFNKMLDSISEKQCSKCLKNNVCNKCMLQMRIENNEFVCDSFTGVEKLKVDLSKRVSFLEVNKEFYNRIIENVNIK